MLAACGSLSESQLDAPVPGAYGSVRDTWRHLLSAEAGYIGRITGARPQPPFKWEDKPTLAEQSAFAVQTGAAYLDLIQRVPPTQNVHEEENGFTMDYHARRLYMQVINHGIEHRTNITTFLASQGVQVPEIDNWGYMAAHADRFQMKEGKVGAG